MALYSVENLVHAYEGKPVLQIDKMSIAPASITGLIGPNGSGKSTLLRLLAFVEKPIKGRIMFQGYNLGPFDPRVRFNVTLLPQSPYLLKRSVFQNVAYGLLIRKERCAIKKKVWQALEMVGLAPEDFAPRYWEQLSGGESQRVALAARLVLRPKVLLLDEPTASVDAASAQLIREAALAARRRWDTTLIIASHDWQWLNQVCDKVQHLFRGRLLLSGHGNLVFGPWSACGQGKVEKILSDGQLLRAHGRPDDLDKAVAVFDADDIVLRNLPPAGSGDYWWVQGVLTRIESEKSSGRILANVVVGNVSFTSTLPLDNQDNTGNFVPGKNLWLGYDPRLVQWY